MSQFRRDFLAFALAREVLRFGQFVTKAGRKTPYFFNAGLFNDGDSLRRLGRFYAEAYLASGIACDQLFGPAYKGITLAAAMHAAATRTAKRIRGRCPTDFACSIPFISALVGPARPLVTPSPRSVHDRHALPRPAP